LWPGGAQTTGSNNEGAVRILNIVVEESRVLASRERCPYLVRVEVVDTNLRGKDSRLYASGAPGIGATMEEALAMSSKVSTVAKTKTQKDDYGDYHIPSELLAPTSHKPQSVTIKANDIAVDVEPKSLPRGGWQENESAFYAHSPDDVYTTNPYDAVRENEFEQLHHQMYNENGAMVHSPRSVTEQR